jgi:hypothetical protein
MQASTPVNFREGESKILIYTSAANKMKFFSAFVRDGLENGDLVNYTYPNEESEIVRTRLREHGVKVEKYEKKGALVLESANEFFMPDGKFDNEDTIVRALDGWSEAKKKGYKHVRDLEDLGDFSFVNGQWQKYIKKYWLDSRWNDPNVSQWATSKEGVGIVYDSFIMEITAINVEHMTEAEVTEILKAFGRGTLAPARFIDLIGDTELFSRSIGLNHERLAGRRILLEFDPTSDYEKVVGSLAKESMANVEFIFVFTSNTSPLHRYLAKQSTIKFFLTSLSTSTPKSTSENTLLLPAKNTPLILDAISKVLETHADTNVCFVFDILSELLTTVGRERTFNFLRHALDMLSSKSMTTLFLLNTSAHEPKTVSQLRNFFSNQLAYDKNGLVIVKTS